MTVHVLHNTTGPSLALAFWRLAMLAEEQGVVGLEARLDGVTTLAELATILHDAVDAIEDPLLQARPAA